MAFFFESDTESDFLNRIVYCYTFPLVIVAMQKSVITCYAYTYIIIIQINS